MPRTIRVSVIAVILFVAPALVGCGTNNTASADGVFHTVCAYVHSLPDDPIVHPGLPRVSHMHDFYGNLSTDASSTRASLFAHATSCKVKGGPANADHSGYWVPQLIFNGTPTHFVQAQAYYESTIGNVKTPPFGLEVIGGDSMATAALSTNIVKWTCSGSNGVGAKTAPPICPSGSLLKVVVKTPNCLLHEKFLNPGAVNDTPFTTYAFQHGGRCPPGYDALPTVRIEVKYPAGVDGRGTITLASGPYYTMHADWFNAWDPVTLDAFVQRCIDADIDCGDSVPARRIVV